MPALPDEFYIDFTGGVRNDKSDLVKNRNEIVEVLNFDLRNQGEAKKRLGSHQFGDTLSGGNIINSVYWERTTAGSSPTTFHITSDDASSALTRKIIGSRLTSAVTAGDSTINVLASTLFDNSGDVEIEGDIIAYTGKGVGTLTGATGALAHESGTAVHQLDPLDASPDQIDGRSGVYFATLNNVLVINGRSGSITFDGTNETAISDADEASGLFATNYRQRIYVAGSGAGDGSGTRNGSVVRVAFTEPGDPTDWGNHLVNFFDVEERRGEAITGLHASPSDELLILKRNSTFAYNEVQLKERSSSVGAYNHFCVEEIDDVMYTFCPSGVYETNGRTFNKISDPIQDYIKDFRPILDSTVSRVVINTFATQCDQKYLLYIGDISSVDSVNDVILVFDTITRRWSVWSGFTDITHMVGMKTFKYENIAQGFEGLFFGDSSGKYYRAFSKKYRDATNNASSNRFTTTGDIYQDLISNTGTPVTAFLQPGLQDLDSPHLLKQFKSIRVVSDGAGFQISYRIEGDNGLSDWVSMGTTKKNNQRFRFRADARGYRIQFKVTHADANSAPTFNGIILEDTITAAEIKRKIKK